MYKIKILRTYTLPSSRENRGRTGNEPHTYDPDDWQTVTEWTAGVLRDAGCTRYSHGHEFVTEEAKITDFARGEEMTATAHLTGFTPEEITVITTLLQSRL